MKQNPLSPERPVAGMVAGGVLAAYVVASAPVHAQEQSPAPGRLGFDTPNMNLSVRPQDDFDTFVNGGWKARTEIPPEDPIWGAFPELRERSQNAIRQIVKDNVASHAEPGTEKRKIADLYLAFMDSARIDKLGIEPLRVELRRIARLDSTSELPVVFAVLRRIGVARPVGLTVEHDPKNSNVYLVAVSQSGLGMPDRDYYLRQDPKFDRIRTAYTAYVGRLLELAGQADPAGAAQRILALETQIARAQWDRAKNRDSRATYNKKTIRELDALTPNFDFERFLATAGLDAATEVNVKQPGYFEALDRIFASVPISTWREYLTYQLLSAYTTELPSAFVQARFDFFGRTLSGQQELMPRWKRALAEVETALGEGLGKQYVARYFKPEAKKRMERLVQTLFTAFGQGIDELDWMSPATKAQAHAKLARITVKIGYPDKWRDYSTLDIRPGDALGNAMRANAFAFDRMVARLGERVDRSEWEMTPQTVDAYANAGNNEIVFPAAILQPPLFDVAVDDAVNYGGIVGFIGHEVSHVFDDQGRQFDAEGNLRDWWTPEDAQAFQRRAERLAAQYSAYTPIDTLHINGRLTLGENIADLSGIATAYRAYKLSLEGKEAPVIEGFTGDQRFFIGWAQIWRSKARPEALRRLLLTDPHSPMSYRAFVPLTNFDPFYAAFDIRPGDKLYRSPEDRVRIW